MTKNGRLKKRRKQQPKKRRLGLFDLTEECFEAPSTLKRQKYVQVITPMKSLARKRIFLDK